MYHFLYYHNIFVFMHQDWVKAYNSLEKLQEQKIAKKNVILYTIMGDSTTLKQEILL